MGLPAAVLRHTTTTVASHHGSSALLASTETAALEAAAAVGDNSLLPFLPRWLKLVLLLVLLLNARSFPGFWHVGLWKHAVLPQLRAKWRGMMPQLRRLHAQNGPDPFRLKSTRRLWAGPDDCDCEHPIVQSGCPDNLLTPLLTTCLPASQSTPFQLVLRQALRRFAHEGRPCSSPRLESPLLR
jgi:hypothetical protein